MTKTERNTYMREWNKKHPEAFRLWISKHPLKWMVANMYQNAKKRVGGTLLSGNGKSYWKDLPIIPYPEFKQWFSERKWQAKSLTKIYLSNGRKRAFAPSLHRKNPLQGYIGSNLEIISVGFNSRLGRIK
jgi:hypothetical protein